LGLFASTVAVRRELITDVPLARKGYYAAANSDNLLLESLPLDRWGL